MHMPICLAKKSLRFFQTASISVPIILNAFAAVILRKLRLLPSAFTARNASPPVTVPAIAAFMQVSCFLVIYINSCFITSFWFAEILSAAAPSVSKEII